MWVGLGKGVADENAPVLNPDGFSGGAVKPNLDTNRVLEGLIAFHMTATEYNAKIGNVNDVFRYYVKE